MPWNDKKESKLVEMDQPHDKTYTGPFAFFSKHLHGDYSLGRSYWVNTILIQLLILVPLLITVVWLASNYHARYGSVGVLVLTFSSLAIWLWGVIGTWVSANKHASRGGRQGWATVAQIMIILGALRVMVDLGAQTDFLSDHFRVAMGNQLGPTVKLQIRADGKSLLLSGGINDGAAKSLSEALDLAPSVTTIVLQSSGGWIREGVLLADVISSRGLNTYT
jgi:hypothetical protein